MWLLTLAITVLAAGSPARSCAQNAPATDGRMLVEGEELTYNVRYGFVNLGQIRIKVLSSWKEGRSRVYHCRGWIDSYRGVPLVDLHAVYQTVMDSSIYSVRFDGKTKDGDHWNFGRYRYDPENARTLIEMGERDSVITKRETLAVTSPCEDGLALFFFARDNLMRNQTLDVPAIVSEKLVNTRIDFRNDRQAVEVDAVDYPVDVLHFEGEAEFVGLYGMTGGFEGWFSNDGARVPILAKLHVLIGSVTVELMEWKRAGWSPPRARG